MYFDSQDLLSFNRFRKFSFFFLSLNMPVINCMYLYNIMAGKLFNGENENSDWLPELSGFINTDRSVRWTAHKLISEVCFFLNMTRKKKNNLSSSRNVFPSCLASGMFDPNCRPEKEYGIQTELGCSIR